MGKDISIVDNVYDSSSFKKTIDHLFEDLLQYYRIDKHILKALYYNRETELDEFESYLKDDINLGGNLLICGNAGIGKTNFIYRIITDETLIAQYAFYPILIDLRPQPLDINVVLMKFIEEFIKYFKIINQPLLNFNNKIEDVIQNLTLIRSHLADIPFVNIKPKPIIFIDDMDYYKDETHWQEILNHMLDFIYSKRISVVLAVRPNLYNDINSCRDNRIGKELKKASLIELSSLNIEDIIKVRLACLMKEDQDKSGLIIKFKKLVAPLLTLIGFDRSGIEEFDYLFTPKLENFMRQITNGNIRQIFEIASEALIFCLKHKDNENFIRIENGKKKVVISHENIINLFTQPNSKYKIINIHEYISSNKNKNKTGNSLLQNILEAIKLYLITDPSFYEKLKMLGHEEKSVNFGIEKLLDYHLIEKEFAEIEKLTGSSDIKQYSLTDKGLFYLKNLIYWEAYIQKFGSSKKSLFMYDISRTADDDIFCDVLEFLQHLLFVIPQIDHKIIYINKELFFKFFCDKYKLKYEKLCIEDNYYSLDKNKFFQYLKQRPIIEKGNRSYTFKEENINKHLIRFGMDKINLKNTVDVSFYENVYQAINKDNPTKEEGKTVVNFIFNDKVDIKVERDWVTIEGSQYNFKEDTKGDVLNAISRLVEQGIKGKDISKNIIEISKIVETRSDITEDEIKNIIEAKISVKSEPEKNRLQEMLVQLSTGTAGSLLASGIILGIKLLLGIP